MVYKILGIMRPLDYQMSSGTSKKVWLPSTSADDVVILQIAHPATCDVIGPAGWVLQHRIATGFQSDDLAQDVWTHIASTDSYRSVTFTFSEDEGEKWIGGLVVRGLDLTTFIQEIKGNATGIVYDPLTPTKPAHAFNYTYSKLIAENALLESFVYTYSKVIQDLEIEGIGIQYTYTKVIEDLVADKGAFVYTYSEVTAP